MRFSKRRLAAAVCARISACFLSLTLLALIGNFLPARFGIRIAQAPMAADPGNDTYPLLNDVRAWAGKRTLRAHCRHTNGLAFFGSTYPTPFGVKTPHGREVSDEDSVVALCDYPNCGWYYARIYYNATSGVLGAFHKSYEVTARNKDFLEVTYHYTHNTHPDTDIIARAYRGVPYINVTMKVMADYPTNNLRCVPYVYSASGSSCQRAWDGIYFPDLGWSNFTGSDSTIDAVHSNNITSWNDNWFLAYKDDTKTTPMFGMAFTNRSEIERIQVDSKASENGIYCVRPWLKGKDGVTKWTGTYLYFAIQNVDPNNSAAWKTVSKDIAHMAMTERSLTYSFVSQTAATKTYEVSATFNDASIGGWSISINKNLPTFPRQDGYFYTACGNISYVSSGSQFTIERFETANPDTHTILGWTKKMVDDWSTNSEWWVNQTFPKVVGWREAYGATRVHIPYSCQLIMGYYMYYRLTGDDTLISKIDAFARFICDNLIRASGAVPKDVTIATGVTNGETYFAFLGLVMAYDLVGNSTFLEKAESNWNWAYGQSNGLDKGWERYYVDCQMLGTILLHQKTNNSTYYNVIENATQQIIDGQTRAPQLDSYAFDDYSYLYGADVSEHSHCIRALDYVMENYGDITSYDLNSYIQKGIEWNLHHRDSFGGQVTCDGARYPYYPCHQTFAASASLFYLDYLMHTEGKFNRTYFKHALENLGWIQGNNELSHDFFNEATGRVERAIYLNNHVPTVSTSKYLYDQGHFLEFLVRLSQVQNDVFQHDHGINVRNGIRVTESNATITAIDLSSSRLTVALSCGNGTSNSRVYCSSRGEPIAIYTVNGTLTWSYDASTTTIALNITHKSPTTILIYWQLPSDVNNDGIVDIVDLALMGKTYGAVPSSLNWDRRCDINGDEIIDIHDLEICDRNYGKNT